MPPASETQGILPSDRGLGLSLLGTAYERKKNKLRQELQQDYKHYVATKKDLKTSEPRPKAEALSLPIDEKISVQEKLREERNKEYNLFLQQQAHIRRLKRETPSATSKPGQVQASDAVCISSPASLPNPDTHANIHPPPTERPASRRDAATLTEAVDYGKKTGTRGRRRWRLPRLKEPSSSEEEPITDTEEELEVGNRRRKDRHTPEPENKKGRRTRKHRTKRTPQDIKEVEPPGVHHQNNNEVFWNSDQQMLDSMKTAARSGPTTSKDKAEFATGLIIGATEERTASQMRKEQYKQELLKQIDEQQRNKIREKKLELRVAATGAADPEKEPERIKQFGAGNLRHDSWGEDVPHMPGIDLKAMEKVPNPRPKDDTPMEGTEQGAPPGQSHMDYSAALSQLRAAQGVPSQDYFNEDYHRNFSSMLGQMAIPRVAGAPPPVLPTVTSNYKTPYDAAYYYYGTRNPLDPNLLYNQNGLTEGMQQPGNFHSPHQRPPPVRPRGSAEATDQQRSDFGELASDKAKQKRDNALSYKEALEQQIKEREERKKREKEEKDQYDAKIEAEMMAYNPWGTSGGGAPIIDQKGNLVIDLDQMHRINEESHRNPKFKNRGQTQSFLIRNGHTAGVEARTPDSHQRSGSSDQPTQELHMQDRYKEDLRQQIEEKKQRKEEQRERMRVEAEKEEKRLAEERAIIQRKYEEEQRKQKMVEQRLENQSWIYEPKTQHQGEVIKNEEKVPESAEDREEKREKLNHERKPSPPIPVLLRKQTNLVTSRPSSVVSQLSSRTESSVSAPRCPPGPAKVPQLKDGQQEVIRELSALRRYLRREQRQLEAQMGLTDPREIYRTPPNRPRGRPRVDAFELAHKQRGAAGAHMQNIREFNQLKYRDTASREEVRHMHPDPPTDDSSLDIQQQALLREQRKIKLMKREEEHDFLDQEMSRYGSRNKPGPNIHRGSMLPSESTFIDFHSGDACEEQIHEQRLRQHSAELQERTAPQRRHDYDEVAASVDQSNCNIQPDAQSLQSVTSLNPEHKVTAHNQHRITRQSSGHHNSRSEGLPGDEEDVLSLRSARERCVSVETVATEPWLRPGTSEAVKRSGCRETPNRRMDAPTWLTHGVT